MDVCFISIICWFDGGLAFVLDGWYVVDQTEVGIVKTFGKIESEPVEPGLHFKMPIVQSVVKMNTYEKTVDMTQKQGNAIKALTAEGLPVVIDLSIQYKIDPGKAPELYGDIKNPESWMTSRILARVRDVIAQYKVEDLYTDKRTEVQEKIATAIQKEFDNKGIIITATLIRNIDLPDQVERSIEQKLKAKQEAEKMTFEVQKARLEAEKKIVEAQGQANATEIMAKAIRENPEILEYKKLEVLEKMASNDNKVFVVPGSNDLILNMDSK
jgi:regulator of protease activity HflC (stomatin/prohibitin superfamily)